MTVKHFALSSQMVVPKDPGMLHERRKHSVLFLCPLQYHNRNHLQYINIYLHGSELQTNISWHTYTHSYIVKTWHKTKVFLSYITVVQKPTFLYEVSLLFVVLYLDYTGAMDTNQDPSKKEALHLGNFIFFQEESGFITHTHAHIKNIPFN